MNPTRIAIALIFSVASASALAAPQLSQAQCNAYPFVKLTQPVTHRQLMNEMGELESEGYNPNLDDDEYPRTLERAQAKLQNLYRQDCTAPMVSSSQGTQVH